MLVWESQFVSLQVLTLQLSRDLTHLIVIVIKNELFVVILTRWFSLVWK